MEDNENLKKQLLELLPRKRGINFYSAKLGISEQKTRELLDEIRNKKIREQSISYKNSGYSSTIEVDFEPKDIKQLALLHKIDENEFVITNYWSKVLPSGKFISSVFTRRRSPEEVTFEKFEKFLTKYKPQFSLPEASRNNNNEQVDIELSIYDFHLAKKHVTSGDNCPYKRAEQCYNIAEDLIRKASLNYNIKTSILPISNDFFHSDNYQNTTTNGTPQDIILDYSKEYELGFDLLVKIILLLKSYSENVHVILVQGNHDRTKSFYLAHSLQVYFSQHPEITFDRDHDVVKSYKSGNTFIGYHHGNCKIDELPLLFATHPKHSSNFGNSSFRCVNVGDKHHYMVKEIKGVRIQQMPSLSGTDRWHLDNNFVHSIRAALLHIYHPIEGKICEYEKRITL